MAKEKSNNPMQAHHRQKRKKEVQRNKQQRIKERDERVIQTKTVAQVKEEIKNLKRRKNLQVSEEQKLQRLEKELKLVKEAEAERPKEAQHYAPSKESLKPLSEIDDPRKSVYYDERLNPYGAPPPGKPRLYHQFGGGVTMNPHLAIVPGQELQPPPPPPPPPRGRPSHDGRPHHRLEANKDSDNDRNNHFSRRNLSEKAKDKSQTTSTSRSSENNPQKVNTTVETKESVPEDKPLVAPSLPAPSKSVQRSRKGKVSVDIWASNEEVDYERRANQLDLEADQVGAAIPKKKKSKKKKLPLEISYKDTTGNIQGPFPVAQMKEWMIAGFFPPTTIVKTNRKDVWVPITELAALQPPSQQTSHESVEDRIASLKKDNQNASEDAKNSVQDRIAALKGETTMEERIANLKSKDAGVPSKVQKEDIPQAPPQLTMDMPAYAIDDGDKEAGETMVSYPVDDEDGVNQSLPQNEEGKLQSETSGKHDVHQALAEPSTDLPSYPVVSKESMASYPADNEDDDLPPPYPVDQGNMEDEEVGSYPISDSMSQEAYPPIDAYPGASEHEDIPYPMNEDVAYPVTDSYPVTNEYPVDNEEESNIKPSEYQEAVEDAPVYPLPPASKEAPQKSIKVDKEVVAFLPSHLQNRKRKQMNSMKKPPTIQKKKLKITTPAVSEDDDMNKFMAEIDELNP